MIVVDGRTDAEKLSELLAAGTEQTELDFKATLDLSQRSSKDVLSLVKDCVAMGNLPTGGYIVVGVLDNGAPAHEHADVEVARFDSADLRARIAKFTEAPVNVVSQAHVVGGRAVVLIYVSPNPDGLPVPFSSVGQYQDGSRTKDIFAEGEIVVREGTSNVRLRFSHWNSLLQRYRAQVREDAARENRNLLTEFTTALREAAREGSPGAVTVPLVIGMEWSAFDDALATHLEASSTVRVQRFLRSVVATIAEHLPDPDTSDEAVERYEQALDAIAVIAINAAQYRRNDVYEFAVKALSDCYEAGGRAPTQDVGAPGKAAASAAHWLQVALRVLAIGRALVAGPHLSLLPQLVNRQVPVSSTGYGYATWIRHAQVAAVQRDMLPEHGGNILSAARKLLGERPWLRPDIASPPEFTRADFDPHDQLLNQLNQFDFWWCVMVGTTNSNRRSPEYYPSCAAFHQYRTQPAIDTIATDDQARDAAFPDQDVTEIAKAFAAVLELADRESMRYGGWWDDIVHRSPAGQFIASHGTGPAT